MFALCVNVHFSQMRRFWHVDSYDAVLLLFWLDWISSEQLPKVSVCWITSIRSDCCASPAGIFSKQFSGKITWYELCCSWLFQLFSVCYKQGGFCCICVFFFNFGLKPHHFTCPAPVFLLALHQVIAEPVTFNCQGGEGDLQLIRLMKEYSFLL